MGRATSYGTKGTELGATMVDRLYKPDGSRRGVVVCHGHAGHAYSWVAAPVAAIDALAAAGYPVVMPELGGDLWGNDASQTKLSDAVTYLQGTLGAKSDKVLLFGYSMGGLTAVNWARANLAKVAAVAIAAPVSLADMHDGNRGGFAAEIETAYGGTSAYATAVASHDPRQGGALAVPSQVWSSDSDTFVTTGEASTYVATLGSSQVALSGVAHNSIPDAVTSASLRAFFDGYR